MFAAEYGWGLEEIKQLPLLAARRLAKKITERLYRETVRIINMQTAAITRGLALSLGQRVMPLPQFSPPASQEPSPQGQAYDSESEFVTERWW